MIRFTTSDLEIIDGLIEKNQRFALYKMPQSDTWHFVMQRVGEPVLLQDIAALNGREGFVMAPFEPSAQTPLVLLQIDQRQLPSARELAELEAYLCPSPEVEPRFSEAEMRENYAACFDDFMQVLQQEEMPKLVLSRQRVEQLPPSCSLAQTFERACKHYPNGFVYLFNTPQTGLWMGSTPEYILAGKKENWYTVALAGTQAFQLGISPVWDAKNRREQDLVVQYVAEQLHQFGAHPRIVGPSTIEAGPVVHLVSQFYFKLKEQNRLGDLLQLLHPTPAVCGLPKQEAYAFILNHENHSRKYYSGFIGELSPSTETKLFVNLRCMHIQQKSYTLYAGGGLLASSQLESEWQETENKMQTMAALFT